LLRRFAAHTRRTTALNRGSSDRSTERIVCSKKQPTAVAAPGNPRFDVVPEITGAGCPETRSSAA
jgi:hypothetical protein